VFENRMLKGMVWPQREEVTGGWVEWRNKELRDLYPSPDIFVPSPDIIFVPSLDIIFAPFTGHYSGDVIKEDEIGWTCGTYGTE
jgi:hypothetical protein